jgi:rubrerythrin
MEKKSIRGSLTESNVLAAFAGESQARTRYSLFARRAKDEGYRQVAAIFKETAKNELEHASIFFGLLEGGNVQITAGYPAGVVRDTMSNLAAAATGEHDEWSAMYGTFADIAHEEGFDHIAAIFRLISKVEAEHEKRFVRLYERLKGGTEFTQERATDWICMKCGFVHHSTDAPIKCPVCGAPQAYFERRPDNY